MSAQKAADLVFVVFDPSDSKSAKNRRQIRSHVTKTQHRRAKEKHGNKPFVRAFVGADHDGRNKVKWQHEVTRKEGAVHDTAAANRSSSGPERGDAALEESAEAVEYQDEGAVALPVSPLIKSFSRGNMSFRTFALDDSENDIGVALSHLNYDVASVLGCYDVIVRTHSVEAENAYKDMPSGTAYPRFTAFLWRDAILLKIAILLMTRYLLGAQRRRPLYSNELYHVLRMRGLLINNITSSLSDPIRGVSDQLLVAVCLFAAHEFHYVSFEAYNTHMLGLVQMINVRGGMRAIGRSDPYMEKFIVWHDTNMATAAGVEPYHLKVKERTAVPRPEPKYNMFRMVGEYKIV